MLTINFQMFKVDLEKAEEPEFILRIIQEVREFQENIYLSFIDYVKTFDCVDYNKLWKILKKMGLTRPLDLPLQKSVCRSRSNS